MTNPYRGRPDYTFWRQAVAGQAASGVDPVTAVPFTLSPGDPIATAGSCFAQHLSRTLKAAGFNWLETERFTGAAGTVDEGYGIFPARFGNLYTARALRQLFDRAYGQYRPKARAWQTAAGAWLDPFRPRIQQGGFPSLEALEEDRRRHLAATRRMFEGCAVFIFTLGLTEGWVSAEDGAAVPLAPGVVGAQEKEEAWRFHNAGFAETLEQMEAFLAGLRLVNPRARVMLTVSPVPLIATYEDRHVLVSTIASKSILRAVAEELTRRDPGIAYFPSYEIVTGPQTGGRYYAEDLREVTPEGVEFVMSVFRRHYLSGAPAAPRAEPAPAAAAPASPPLAAVSAEEVARYQALTGILCDEEAIVSPAVFPQGRA
ncbi:GSCFA domain-containing protein [Siccirubricoccus phaeus]|uniref:GSCFA domain-containing protein n=1 Tax=Siccirubricoccus phaeus TaxID=2595053 RepID=UPI001A9C52F6|nr:GSCFA domain-containing protein [Siccirubricoccus phaeus]